MPHSDLPNSLLRRMYRTMVLIGRFGELVARPAAQARTETRSGQRWARAVGETDGRIS